MLGTPAEYFHRGDEQFWRGRWGAADEDAFLSALRREPLTVNGVWASKMMWNYFADAIARLRDWPRLDIDPAATDAAVLATAFPGLRYVWLRREDKVRQAISWWRAEATGQYALPACVAPAEPPAFDPEAIGRLVSYAEACEAGWREWFAASSIEPLEIVYEDLIEDPGKAVRDVARFLDVTMPPALSGVEPRTKRQADQHTERFVRLFNRLDNPEQGAAARGDAPELSQSGRAAGTVAGEQREAAVTFGDEAQSSAGGRTGAAKHPSASAHDKLLMEKLRLAKDGSPGTATILALGQGSDHTATIKVQPDNGAEFETTTEVLKGHLEVGQSVRVRFNPAHHSKVVLLNTNSVGGLWHVPSHCPDCGAPVDLSVASVAAHPVCDYCGHSIPCDPA